MWNDDTKDDSLVIYMYSVELYLEIEVSNPFQIYREMNAAMRTGDADAVARWRPMIFHLAQALQRLPSEEVTVYRGIPAAVSPAIYRPGRGIAWPAFSSSTTDGGVAKTFSKDAAEVTIFSVTSKLPRPIARFSQFPEEAEMLFPPSCIFKVRDVTRAQEEGGRTICTIFLADIDPGVAPSIAELFGRIATLEEGERFVTLPSFARYMTEQCNFMGKPEDIEEEAKILFRAYDRDHDGRISYADFFTYTISFRLFSAEVFEIVFDIFDHKNRGYFTAEDLTKVISVSTSAIGKFDINAPEVQALLHKTVAELMQEADADQDGRICRQELWHRVAQGDAGEQLLRRLKELA